MLFARAYLVIQDHRQCVNQSVLSVQSVLKQKLVSTRDVWTHVQEHADWTPDALLLITILSVAVLQDSEETHLQVASNQ